MRSIIVYGVMWKISRHEQGVDVFSLKTLHVGFSEVGIEVARDVVVPRGELKARGKVADAFVRGRNGGKH